MQTEVRVHVERKNDAELSIMLVEGKALVGRPRKTWQNIVCRHASAER